MRIPALSIATAILAFGSPAAAVSVSSEMPISRATSEHEWPFAVDEGTLTCVALQGQRVVIFAEPWRTDVLQEFGNMTLPRSVIVSANPIALFGSYEHRDLYLPFDSLETLIRRLAPFEAMGARLCDADAAPPEQTP